MGLEPMTPGLGSHFGGNLAKGEGAQRPMNTGSAPLWMADLAWLRDPRFGRLGHVWGTRGIRPYACPRRHLRVDQHARPGCGDARHDQGRLAGDEAMWAGPEEDRERQRRERDQRIADYERQWGRKPPEFQRVLLGTFGVPRMGTCRWTMRTSSRCLNRCRSCTGWPTKPHAKERCSMHTCVRAFVGTTATRQSFLHRSVT
jgi:hypothetical protein